MLLLLLECRVVGCCSGGGGGGSSSNCGSVELLLLVRGGHHHVHPVLLLLLREVIWRYLAELVDWAMVLHRERWACHWLVDDALHAVAAAVVVAIEQFVLAVLHALDELNKDLVTDAVHQFRFGYFFHGVAVRVDQLGHVLVLLLMLLLLLLLMLLLLVGHPVMHVGRVQLHGRLVTVVVPGGVLVELVGLDV